MRTQVLQGQQSLDLFADERGHKVPGYDEDGACEWLINTHKCTEAIRPYVRGLFAEFDAPEAFDRCKCIPSLDGLHKVDGWELQDGIDYYCMYSHELDYHTVLDRSWAARNGLSKDDVYRLSEWDYGKKKPIFN